MKTIFLLALLTTGILTGRSQDQFYTRNGHVDFFSHAPLEDIQANNEQVALFLNTTNGELSAAMLMKSFRFEKALMQQHFNENYVESDKFPRAEFEGQIAGFTELDLAGGKPREVTAKGKITIHGVTRELTVTGTIAKVGGNYEIDAVFILKPADFEIRIPASVKDNIAEEIRVTLDATLQKM